MKAGRVLIDKVSGKVMGRLISYDVKQEQDITGYGGNISTEHKYKPVLVYENTKGLVCTEVDPPAFYFEDSLEEQAERKWKKDLLKHLDKKVQSQSLLDKNQNL